MRVLLPCLAALLLSLPGAAAAQDDRARLIDLAVPKIERLYLHPEAIDPAAMAAAGLQRLERASPAVLVLEPTPGELTLSARGSTLTLRIDDLVTLDDARVRVLQGVDFVAAALADDEDIDLDDLEVEALNGMLRTVDRHSRLIVGDGLDEFNTRFKGTLVGVGARVGRRAGLLKIIEPFDDAPAGRAGLKAGDVVTHIDGHPTAALTVDDAVDRIRGPEGVPVVLTVERPGEEGRRIFVIKREKVLVPSVESELLSGGVGVITIDHFSQKTSQEFATHLTRLQEQDPDLRGLVIDLRGNTGGSMRQAARIVNHFVDEGTLVRTEGRTGGPVERLTPRIDADARYMRWTGPVAVLVDNRTASGSEIVAGGLKYLGRSVTIGSQTFGKGTVQKVYPLRKGAEPVSLKLTVARYLLPGDSFINSVGVTPDIMTGAIWLSPAEPTLPEQIREPASLSGHAQGNGGLDSRRNPGGGREPLTTGVNAEPVLRLWYPRVYDGWGPGAGLGDHNPAPTDDPHADPDEDEAEAAEEPTPAPPGWNDTLPGDAGEPMFNDVELRIAWEVLTRAGPDDTRNALLALAAPIVQEWREAQGDRMQEAASAASMAWRPEPPGWMDRAPATEDAVQARLLQDAPAGVEATLHLPERFVAGEETSARLVVRNRGDEPLHHLRGLVESSGSILDEASFLIGDLQPGEERGWSIPVAVSTRYRTRLDDWRLYLVDDSGPLGGPFDGVAETRGADLPNLSMQVRTAVAPQADGSIEMLATIKVRNDGEGLAEGIRVHFGEPKLEGVERVERFTEIEELKPGESAEVELRLRVRDPSVARVPIRLRARDSRTATATVAAVELPTASALQTGWLAPPTIEMSAPHSSPSAPPARAGVGFVTRGKVRAKAGLASVEVRVGTDQVFSRELAGEKELSVEAPALLEVGPNAVRVEVVTADGVEVTRYFYVFGTKE